MCSRIWTGNYDIRHFLFLGGTTTVLDEVVVEYPVGHKRRREEGKPLLLAKFDRHIAPHFDAAQVKKIKEAVSDLKRLSIVPVDQFTNLFVKS